MKKLIFLRLKQSQQSGQAMLTAVVFFLLISTTIVLGIATPILKQVKIASDLVHSKESYYLAEGALEDAVYRVENSKTIVTGDTISLDGYTTTISLTTTSTGKTIDATSNRNGIIRKMEAQIVTGTGVSFGYGVQAGIGGFSLSGGSTIKGNAYANGPIAGTGGSSITGTAIAADSSALSADQTNNTPATPSNTITFANANATQDVAQSFQVSTTGQINYVQFYIKKVGAPSNVTVKLVADKNGSPGTTILDTATLGDSSGANAITTNLGWVNATFSNNATLTAGTTYWLVLDATTNSSKYYILGANSGGYSNGIAKVGQYSGSWSNTSPSGLDAYFTLYLGGIPSYIGGGSYVGALTVGSGGVGDAWAHTVSGTSVAGNIYCQTGSNNNKSCNTTRSDPSLQGYPISSANIQEWEDEGSPTGGWTYPGSLTIGNQGTTTSSLGTVNGSLTVNGGGVATMGSVTVNGDVTVSGGGTLKIGPLKVNGNLTVQSNMIMTGTVWVTGNVIISNGGSVKLDSSYSSGSGVIISNGYMNLSGAGSFSGSGQGNSYALLVTTSTCPNGSSCGSNDAIDINGGAGAVVLDAQYGTIDMSGGTAANAVTANEIVVSNGGTVNYSSGLTNVNFTSGPSGSYTISSWNEVQ